MAIIETKPNRRETRLLQLGGKTIPNQSRRGRRSYNFGLLFEAGTPRNQRPAHSRDAPPNAEISESMFERSEFSSAAFGVVSREIRKGGYLEDQAREQWFW